MMKLISLISLLLLIGLSSMLLCKNARRGLQNQNNTASTNFVSISQRTPLMFTTEAYNKEALRLVIQEANQVAEALQLPENLPITTSNITDSFIAEYGVSRFLGGIGSVSASNYIYYVSVNDKFSFVDDIHLNEEWGSSGRIYPGPLATNDAYQTASQWLSAASMDVKGLDRDCKLSIWSSFARQWPSGTLAPVYWICWTKDGERGSVAYVEYFAQTRKLLSLTVFDDKYILRKPIIFTNLDYLLSLTNSVR